MGWSTVNCLPGQQTPASLLLGDWLIGSFLLGLGRRNETECLMPGESNDHLIKEKNLELPGKSWREEMRSRHWSTELPKMADWLCTQSSFPIFLKYSVKYILLPNVCAECCSMVMFMLMVWRPYCEKHCPLKEHIFVSKRVGFEKPLEDSRDSRQGWPRQFWEIS